MTPADLPHLVPAESDREAVLAALESLVDPEPNPASSLQECTTLKKSLAEIDPETPQIVVEVRFISCPPDLISPHGFDLQSGWALLPNRLDQKNGADRITDQIAKNASSTAGVVSITEAYLPVAFRFLDKSQIENFMVVAQGDCRTNVLQAPKITMFSDQSGTVSDSTENYFVTSVREIQGDYSSALQPGIERVHEGQWMTLQPELLENGSVAMKRCDIVMRNIENVNDCVLVRHEAVSRETTIPSNIPEMTVSGTTIQAPRVKTTCISLPITIPEEKVLLVAFPDHNSLKWDKEGNMTCLMIHCSTIFAEEIAQEGRTSEVVLKPISDEWERFLLSDSTK